MKVRIVKPETVPVSSVGVGDVCVLGEPGRSQDVFMRVGDPSMKTAPTGGTYSLVNLATGELCTGVGGETQVFLSNGYLALPSGIEVKEVL
jgi:hypothetical protein